MFRRWWRTQACHQIDRRQIAGLHKRRRIPQNSIVAGIDDVQISARIHGESYRVEQTGAEVGARTLRGGCQEIALPDNFVRKSAGCETRSVFPGQDAIITGVGDIENRGADGSIHRDGLRAAELPALHQVGSGGGQDALLLQNRLAEDSGRSRIKDCLRVGSLPRREKRRSQGKSLEVTHLRCC
jgi:hypothetical protein